MTVVETSVVVYAFKATWMPHQPEVQLCVGGDGVELDVAVEDGAEDVIGVLEAASVVEESIRPSKSRSPFQSADIRGDTLGGSGVCRLLATSIRPFDL